MWLDQIQGLLYGTIKALGQQRQAAYVNFITYYIIMIPLAYLLTFKFPNPPFGFFGIWYASIVAMCNQSVMYYIIIWYRTDWQQSAVEAFQRKNIEVNDGNKV